MAKLAVLVATGWVLVATSRAPCSTNTPESVVLLVAGDCGPAGSMVLNSDSSCLLTVDGGAALWLPEFGQQSTLGPITTAHIALNSWVWDVDGGTVPLLDGGVRAPASVDQTGACIGNGCPHGNYRQCAGDFDGGVLELTCTTDGEVCSAQLTVVP